MGVGWKKDRQDPDVILSGVRLAFTIKVRQKKTNRSPVENFSSRFDEIFLSKVRLKI